ncbi:hypothetical protein GCM10010464_33930 [Pseudonocardia yunnanensis]|uniref:Helix-turn-helix transcriptional regulator n=1 Tax=Pseudonocardia yunnanensis TaxID=58107 RepID=A0ABW4EQ26_9PSEU
MQILDFSGEELEDAAGEFAIPVIARTGPHFRGRAASQELGETLTLTRTHWGQMSSVRTDRMTARASADNLMLFCIYIVLLDMMRTHVREHLADPNLRVEELARRHHVSVSHAYTLFERIGTTPGAYLREERLLAAEAMLSGRGHDRLTISAVAAAVGFLDLRTFERAFRRRYGTTPSSWRSEHLPAGSAPRP